jgi:hypothetical protein
MLWIKVDFLGTYGVCVGPGTVPRAGGPEYDGSVDGIQLSIQKVDQIGQAT